MGLNLYGYNYYLRQYFDPYMVPDRQVRNILRKRNKQLRQALISNFIPENMHGNWFGV